MNTKSLLTRIGVPVLSLGLLGGLGATLATSASASTMATTVSAVSSSATVTANTHLNNHPDTTSASGGAILPGNVWAYDNATEKFTVTNTGGNTWLVTMGYVGSFHGFADPRVPTDTPPGSGLGAALDSAGSVKGTISYTVTSLSAPDPSRLPGQSPSDATISGNIRTLFGDPSATVSFVPNSYTFTYHQIEGQDYTQVG